MVVVDAARMDCRMGCLRAGFVVGSAAGGSGSFREAFACIGNLIIAANVLVIGCSELVMEAHHPLHRKDCVFEQHDHFCFRNQEVLYF